jgi:hypothetical protein
MAWGSLRFSDCQRLDLEKLVLGDEDLRGLIWRSKTATSGLPFGIITSGFLSHGSHNWVWKFLSTLDQLYASNSVGMVDFLLPDCDNDNLIFPLVPMNYPTVLYFLRKFLHCPWRSSCSPMMGMDLNYTMHSLKATLLSWGPQLESAPSPELRLQQGHHVAQSFSLAVYSRDSVWGALKYQNQIRSMVHGGWRPKTAQHRGSQQPLTEPAVVLEKFSKAKSDFQWFQFTDHMVDPIVEEEAFPIDSSDSSSGSSSSDSSDEDRSQEPSMSKEPRLKRPPSKKTSF